MAETQKACERRLREGWFALYAPADLPGIDIGAGSDPLNHSFRRWDKADGDATLMDGVPDDLFHTVYASHVLEHLDDPILALHNWFRILRPGGHLIVVVPHRDLYEKRRTLPSSFNGEHKTFWLPSLYDPPCTFSLKHTLLQATPEGELVSVAVCDEGYEAGVCGEHSRGEFSIEAIVRKRPQRESTP